jgi:hypothetical protein
MTGSRSKHSSISSLDGFEFALARDSVGSTAGLVSREREEVRIDVRIKLGKHRGLVARINYSRYCEQRKRNLNTSRRIT